MHDVQQQLVPGVRQIDLSASFIRQAFVFPTGMVLVLEPVVWEDGTGGYRSEEIVLITDDGYRRITDYPYSPYAG